VNETNGVITLISTLPRDQSQHQFNVIARDPNKVTEPNTAQVSVTVNVNSK